MNPDHLEKLAVELREVGVTSLRVAIPYTDVFAKHFRDAGWLVVIETNAWGDPEIVLKDKLGNQVVEKN